MWNRLNAFVKGTYTNCVDPDETPHNVSSGSALFAIINTLLVMVDYKNCIWSGPHSLCVNIRIVIVSSHIFGANAFLHIRSYAPGNAGCVCSLKLISVREPPFSHGRAQNIPSVPFLLTHQFEVVKLPAVTTLFQTLILIKWKKTPIASCKPSFVPWIARLRILLLLLCFRFIPSRLIWYTWSNGCFLAGLLLLLCFRFIPSRLIWYTWSNRCFLAGPEKSLYRTG